MPLPPAVINKNPGDPVLSADWRTMASEVDRLDRDKANLSGAIFTGPLEISSTTILHHATNARGTPDGDGFRFRYEENFFNNGEHALVIEKTDGSNAVPLGGIAFVNSGSDGATSSALEIRGDGRVLIPGLSNLFRRLSVKRNDGRRNRQIEFDTELPLTDWNIIRVDPIGESVIYEVTAELDGIEWPNWVISVRRPVVGIDDEYGVTVVFARQELYENIEIEIEDP